MNEQERNTEKYIGMVENLHEILTEVELDLRKVSWSIIKFKIFDREKRYNKILSYFC